MASPRPARFATAFDPEVPALEAPGVLQSGSDEVIRIVDGFARGVGIVGRFTAASGMLGIKVDAGGGPLRVELLLRADRTTSRWSVKRGSGDPAAAPRLVVVSAQGTVRAAGLLVRSRDVGAPARAWLRFDLAADEVPADGLLVLELRGAAGLGSWAADAAKEAALGLALIRVEVSALHPSTPRRTSMAVVDGATAERQGLVSSGDLPDIDAVGGRVLLRNCFIVNPAVTDHPVGSALVVDLAATLSTRAESLLPQPLPRLIDGGPVGSARRKATSIRKRLVPLQAAAVRELRRELNLPRVARAVERSTLGRVTEPAGLVTSLQQLGALQVDVLRLQDGAPATATQRDLPDSVELLMRPDTEGPLMVLVQLDEVRAAPLLRGRTCRFTLASVGHGPQG